MDHATYDIKGVTSDGSIVSQDMPTRFERGYISVLFYTDETLETPTTPTSGTVTVEGSETGINYGSIDSGVIDLSVVDYDRPNFSGHIQNVKITCDSVVGAGYFVATVARFGG